LHAQRGGGRGRQKSPRFKRTRQQLFVELGGEIVGEHAEERIEVVDIDIWQDDSNESPEVQ